MEGQPDVKQGGEKKPTVTSQNIRLSGVCTFSEGSAQNAIKRMDFCPLQNTKLRFAPTTCKSFHRSPHMFSHIPAYFLISVRGKGERKGYFISNKTVFRHSVSHTRLDKCPAFRPGRRRDVSWGVLTSPGLSATAHALPLGAFRS